MQISTKKPGKLNHGPGKWGMPTMRCFVFWLHGTFPQASFRSCIAFMWPISLSTTSGYWNHREAPSWCFHTAKIPDLSVTMFSFRSSCALPCNYVQYMNNHESWHDELMLSRFLKAVVKNNANLEAMFCHQKTLHQKMCSAMGSSLAVFESSSKNPGPNGGSPGADGAHQGLMAHRWFPDLPLYHLILLVFSYQCFLMTPWSSRGFPVLRGSPIRMRGDLCPLKGLTVLSLKKKNILSFGYETPSYFTPLYRTKTHPQARFLTLGWETSPHNTRKESQAQTFQARPDFL